MPIDQFWSSYTQETVIRFFTEPYTYPSHYVPQPSNAYVCARRECPLCLMAMERDYREVEMGRWADDGGLNPADNR